MQSIKFVFTQLFYNNCTSCTGYHTSTLNTYLVLIILEETITFLFCLFGLAFFLGQKNIFQLLK